MSADASRVSATASGALDADLASAASFGIEVLQALVDIMIAFDLRPVSSEERHADQSHRR